MSKISKLEYDAGLYMYPRRLYYFASSPGTIITDIAPYPGQQVAADYQYALTATENLRVMLWGKALFEAYNNNGTYVGVLELYDSTNSTTLDTDVAQMTKPGTVDNGAHCYAEVDIANGASCTYQLNVAASVANEVKAYWMKFWIYIATRYA